MQNGIAIPTDRLLDAVNSVPAGLTEMGRVHAGTMPSSSFGTADQPRVFCDLTGDEVIAAERFLFRCGILSDPRVPPSQTVE